MPRRKKPGSGGSGGSKKPKQPRSHGEPRHLIPGAESRSPSPHEEEQRVDELQATVEYYCPEFANMVDEFREAAEKGGPDICCIHQDAFAAGYHDDEYVLLGMAVKYAGLYGVPLHITGKNHETF